ncbi:phosphotransferase [Leptospira sp. 'Mane']|uniref:phosphotransferase n=1 Tax=Leptospira sp. 'Mane' TaxID=3387407 RepID=UPI00398A9635
MDSFDSLGVFSLLEKIFQIDRTELGNFVPNENGITNLSWSFSVRGDKYMFRYPGELSRLFVNRQIEYDAYQSLISRGIQVSDELVYLDPHTGIKITKFIENFKHPDFKNISELSRSVHLIKQLHTSGIKVDSVYDFKETFLNYEKSLPVDFLNYVPDYTLLRKKFFNVLDELKIPADPVFCHTDPIPYNFLLKEDRDYIIDFEYASMGFYLFDLAAMIVYGELDKEWLHVILEIYSGEAPSSDLVSELAKYVGITSMIWVVFYLGGIGTGRDLEIQLKSAYRYASLYLEKF